jgi:hypothetical protein
MTTTILLSTSIPFVGAMKCYGTSVVTKLRGLRNARNYGAMSVERFNSNAGQGGSGRTLFRVRSRGD